MVQVIQVICVIQVIQVVQVVQVVRMISLDDMHLENIWFSWFKASSIIVIEKRWYITPVRDGGRKVEKRAVFWKTRNRKNI